MTPERMNFWIVTLGLTLLAACGALYVIGCLARAGVLHG